jgi:uncharacterized protein YecE (DUF72 family)
LWGNLLEFGRIESIEDINWSLPRDSEQSLSFINNLKTQNLFALRFGTPAWAHREWIGKIYPKGTKPAEFLSYYSRQYGSVEFNSSHYRIPTLQQVQKWRSQVPANFLFCAKFFQGISHSTHGLQDENLLKTWLRFLESLQENRGPSFLQLPPHFDYQRKAELHTFLKKWPNEFELSLEFRHPSWFQDGQLLPLLAEYLHSRRIGMVITDVAGRRDVLHSTVTSSFAMIRFIGNALHPSDDERLKLWSQKIKKWKQAGLERVFLFIHEPDDILCPEMTNRAVAILNQDLGLKLSSVAVPIESHSLLSLPL